MGQKPTKEIVVDFTVKAAFCFFAEFFGTAAMILVGCLACSLFPVDGKIHEYAAAFGFSMVLGIEIAINVSGGHLNPMLTVACAICGYISVPMSTVYIIAQILGSLLGVGLVVALNPKEPEEKGFCNMMPFHPMHRSQALFLEFVASSIFVLVICSMWDHRRKNIRETYSIKAGLTVYALTLVFGPFTGSSMNPVRAFAPAVWNHLWGDFWVYLVSGLAAGVIWSSIYSKILVRFSPFKKDLSDGYKLYEFERERRRLEREREKEREKDRARQEKDKLLKKEKEKGEKQKEKDERKSKKDKNDREKQKDMDREFERMERDSSPI